MVAAAAVGGTGAAFGEAFAFQAAQHGGQVGALQPGLFRSVLADVPAHLGGIGSGALITLQQSGLALGVATLGSLYLAWRSHSYPRAFATVECVQMGIVALLALGAAALPRFTQTSTGAPAIDA